MLRRHLRIGMSQIKCLIISPPGRQLLLFLYQSGLLIAREEKNKVNGLKRTKGDSLTHMSKKFMSGLNLDVRCSNDAVRNLFLSLSSPCHIMSWPHPQPGSPCW